MHRLFKLAPLAALCAAAAPALATNGYFAHGYGLKAKGMGGAATAMADDAFGGANNPANMTWVGSRIDLGGDVFSPEREAERSGAGFPPLDGKVESGRKAFLLPEFGMVRPINDRLAVGVTVYGNGGMNTSYPQGPFMCPTGPTTAAPANMLCGAGSLGVDLIQLIVAPTIAYKIAERHSVGVSLLLGYQRFSADGLQAFDSANFSGAPGSVTNRGHDSSTGVGLRVGWLGRLNDMVSVGAAYAPKMSMGRFEKYKGLFAGNGGFDIPSNYSVGIAITPLPAWTFALDAQRINYGEIPSVGGTSQVQAPLGSANGPGFGWRDIDVVKLGAVWRASDTWTLRAGYNRGGNPIGSADVTFNILAPGVMKDHYTAGFTMLPSKSSEFTMAVMVAPRQSVSGPSLFNGVMGAGVAGNETIRMREASIGAAWAWKF